MTCECPVSASDHGGGCDGARDPLGLNPAQRERRVHTELLHPGIDPVASHEARANDAGADGGPASSARSERVKPTSPAFAVAYTTL